jgi:hypothetical protein
MKKMQRITEIMRGSWGCGGGIATLSCLLTTVMYRKEEGVLGL